MRSTAAASALSPRSASRPDQRSRIGERGHAPARVAFTAKIVRKALAIRGLREHAGERVFADAARAGE